MRQRLNLRLKALEKCMPDQTDPRKTLLPEWLVEELRQQGIRFDTSGLPEKSSIDESVPEQIAPALPASSMAAPRSFYGQNRYDIAVQKIAASRSDGRAARSVKAPAGVRGVQADCGGIHSSSP